jgi:CubicO group peptidase (beta-lactamase class C family)
MRSIGATRAILLSAAALSLSAVAARAQDIERMDHVVRASVEANAFSGSVLVARDGRILLDRGYGFANREWNIPNDGETKFRLASVTKQFTAVAIMLLNERGLVDLDAPVKTWLPEAPPAWDGVTVRHLLTHTSGVPDYTGFDDYEALKTLPTSVDGLIGRFRDRPLEFQPGENWAYSNSGYVLLTAIIQKVSGQSYAAFVAENLFRPAGMNDSGYDSHAAILPRRASGYTPTRRGIVNAGYIDMTVPQGAGALYSTTRDLLKWEEALFGGRLLDPASLATLTRPYRDNYALGLTVKTEKGDTTISHSGGIEGFNTHMAYDPERRLTVIVLSNLNGPAAKLGMNLMTLARGGTVVLNEERRAIAISPEAMRPYEGVYELSPDFSITVAVVDGKLTVQGTGQSALEMQAEAQDAFFSRAIDAQISFTRNDAGAVTGLVLHQGGSEMSGRRK